MGRISYQVVPNGGWKYNQNNYWLTADTWDLLIQLVKLHRKNNGITLGNVEKDVEDQICEFNPYLIINIPKIKR